MLAKNVKSFIELFETLEEPRVESMVLHPISEILFLAIVGVLCCAESWRELVQFGQMNIKFLRNYFPFENGIPSKSVLSRVFGMIDKKMMEQLLMSFAKWMHQKDSEIDHTHDGGLEVIAIDGKRIKGSNIHLLHAFATRFGIVLAQVDIENKVNESKEVPAMLEKLDIAGTVITTDALNCQKPIVEKIRQKKADYFLALKGNQEKLLGDARIYFAKKIEEFDFHEEINKEHGRLEVRRCWSTSDIKWLMDEHSDWYDLKSICCIEREREIKGRVTQEQVIYITSTEANAKEHLRYARQHWQVENGLHWVLDVVFKEDQSAYRAKNAAQNMAIIRKLVINMIKHYKRVTQDETAIKTMRKVSSWSKDKAAKVLKHMAG